MATRNWTGAPMYEVIVGNVGKVHEGTDKEQAIKVWTAYVALSASGEGRCAGEGVSLFYDDMEHGSDILPGYDYQPPEEMTADEEITCAGFADQMRGYPR